MPDGRVALHPKSPGAWAFTARERADMPFAPSRDAVRRVGASAAARPRTRGPPGRKGPTRGMGPAYGVGLATETEWIAGNWYGTSSHDLPASGETNSWPVVVPA